MVQLEILIQFRVTSFLLKFNCFSHWKLIKWTHYFNQSAGKNNFYLSISLSFYISQCVLNKGKFALEKAVNMEVANGKGTVKPSDLFISTAISFKKCLSLLLLLQSQNKTASCPSEINPKASEAATNEIAYNEHYFAIHLPLSSASSRNLASREWCLLWASVSILPALLLNASFSTSSLLFSDQDALFSSPPESISL